MSVAFKNRTRVLLPVLSVVTAGTLFIGPIAFADEDHGDGDRGPGRGDGDDRGRVTIVVPAAVTTTVVQRRDDDNENENENVVVSATPLVNAINNEVANLTNRDVEMEDEDEVEQVEVGQIATISLATLETGLSSADATAVTNAVNANSAALQTFLNNGTTNATGIKNALTAAGLNPANVLAILVGRENRLIAVTA